uniref:Uncharacterized protein n=1 Tax=Rhizophora mucronata TaxID=61149 RepID=A0A2P2III9_RHIMU
MLDCCVPNFPALPGKRIVSVISYFGFHTC